ncbi:hypothetical protein FEM48_Zijuj03G0122900 [Ziziphus jujuba var. spinosa]|uniref:Bifunctional inhibitor/plant lipid transfer protein/seed storage helical domain-containing protein n=1 Tax=Ziziphus jujuba var. spinosa TaxID=714518 RepID=A0A978VQ95_ZIZJJ|nr:uncharacterized protein LOC125421462 [Ziziphus jujuba var. spinosa]KAH7537720.1 hypothetical protein FEM48_Zijuj03G0122900 [Ziziphus jujuba var. spinosa]
MMMMVRASGKLVVIIMVMVTLGNFEEVPILGINGDTSPSQCKEEKDLLVKECKPIIFGSKPSGSCCQRIRVTHVECVCPLVTPKIASLINVKRVIKQIEGCGRTVPHHFKCGSITTP